MSILDNKIQDADAALNQLVIVDEMSAITDEMWAAIQALKPSRITVFPLPRNVVKAPE